MKIVFRLSLALTVVILTCFLSTSAFAATPQSMMASHHASSWTAAVSYQSTVPQMRASSFAATRCDIICDGAPWSSNCARTQTRAISVAFDSIAQPSRVLFVLQIFVSSGCRSLWGAFANNSGVTLTGVEAFLTRTSDGVTTVIPGQPISLTNPHSTSTAQLDHISGVKYTIEGCAWDYGNAGYECATVGNIPL